MDYLFLFIVLAIACIFYILANYDHDESYLNDVADHANQARIKRINDDVQTSYDLIAQIDAEFETDPYEWRE